jgi:RHS repeat-associated protein
LVGWQFTYDDLGNRITLNNRAGNNVVYAHNVANEYTSIGGTNVSHDAAGNLSADPNGYTYEYDNDNRLTKIKDSGAATVAEFTYDALGRRIEAIDSVASTTTRYYYDGWRVLSETNAAGTKQRHYVYGNYLDEVLLLIHDDGQATPTYTDYYYAHNHLYSPTALIEDDGDVVERYEYDVYGKQYVMEDDYDPRDSTSYDNVILFTGQRLDSLDSGDLQLMYYKNRYYCLSTGRFLQRDPLEYVSGVNLYEYVLGNPVIYLDPHGLDYFPTWREAVGCGGKGISEPHDWVYDQRMMDETWNRAMYHKNCQNGILVNCPPVPGGHEQAYQYWMNEHRRHYNNYNYNKEHGGGGTWLCDYYDLRVTCQDCRNKHFAFVVEERCRALVDQQMKSYLSNAGSAAAEGGTGAACMAVGTAIVYYMPIVWLKPVAIPFYAVGYHDLKKCGRTLEKLDNIGLMTEKAKDTFCDCKNIKP